MSTYQCSLLTPNYYQNSNEYLKSFYTKISIYDNRIELLYNDGVNSYSTTIPMKNVASVGFGKGNYGNFEDGSPAGIIGCVVISLLGDNNHTFYLIDTNKAERLKDEIEESIL